MNIESHSRPTIMDGKVVTYSTAFRQSEGIFGPEYEAAGHFEVSASRNAVMVHRASIASKEELEALIEALNRAFVTMEVLR